MNQTAKQILAIAGLVATAAIWGLTFIFVKWTIAEMDLYYYLFLRFALAAFFFGLVYWKHIFRVDRSTIKSSLIIAVFVAAAYIAQTEGLKITSATNTAMITGLYIVLIPIFSAVFFREKSFFGSIIGAIVSFIGLYFLTQYSFVGVNVGDFLVLLCAVGFAWHVIFTGKFTVKHDTRPFVLYQLIFIALIFGVLTLVKGTYTSASAVPMIGWITIVICALFATVFAFVVMALAQKFVDPTRVGIIHSTEAVFGAFFAWWLGGETLTPIALTGACLMFAGMLVSEIHPIAKYIKTKLQKPQ